MGEVSKSGFDGLRVLSFESRRGAEMTKLIANAGGVPTVVASMREVPLEDNHEGMEFVRELVAGKIDTVVFLTGVGAQVVLRVAESANQREAYLDALKKIPVVARGPKPVSVLRPLGVPIALTAPEPNTWRELLQALDANGAVVPLRDKMIAVQEYGATNEELLAALRERGARVRKVPVYDWQLPEDVGPLRNAVQLLVQRQIDVVFFTTSVQVRHLMLVADEMRLTDEVPGRWQICLSHPLGPSRRTNCVKRDCRWTWSRVIRRWDSWSVKHLRTQSEHFARNVGVKACGRFL